MILLRDILALHLYSINLYGGGEGIRDLGGLEAAIARPFATFGGQDLYQTSFEKAAAIGESIIMNHPFVDGNKRTGFLAMITLLRDDGILFNGVLEESYNFVIKISTGEIKFDEIVSWLKENSKPL
jgi:death on curing protein